MVASLTGDDPGEFQLDKLYLNLLKKIYKGDLNSGEIDIDTTLANAKTYMKGVFEGFGGDFSGFRYDTPDYNKLAHIERNVYQFSGAKNYHQLRELTSALKDGDRIRPFNDFKTEASKILDEYQGSWLQTEYNAAIAGSQMASKWVDFEKHPEALLEYRTMEDDRVREEHRQLDRIIRPVNDPFWKTYYPPNGWNCRCTIIRLNDGAKTPDKNLQYPDIANIFKTNLGQQGLVFPAHSPYFIGCPKEILKQAASITPRRIK